MVILKKIKGATLMETLIATVVIVIIFMISSLTIYNSLKSYKRSRVRSIEHIIKEITYLEKRHQNVPNEFPLVYGTWEINISKERKGDTYILIFNGVDQKTGQTFNKEVIHHAY